MLKRLNVIFFKCFFFKKKKNSCTNIYNIHKNDFPVKRLLTFLKIVHFNKICQKNQDNKKNKHFEKKKMTIFWVSFFDIICFLFQEYKFFLALEYSLAKLISSVKN